MLGGLINARGPRARLFRAVCAIGTLPLSVLLVALYVGVVTIARLAEGLIKGKRRK